MPKPKTESPILVTGAGGYIASWIVKYLLEEGYNVHGTIRSKQETQKISHLLELQNKFPNKLKLFEADLLKMNSFDEAAKDAMAVIHTASPFFVTGIKDPQRELIDPALLGTRNVLTTVNKTPSVKKVILTSSVAAVMGDGRDAEAYPNKTLDESIWNTSSSLHHQPYSYSKFLAEKEAWALESAQTRWKLVTINPSFVLGPSLSSRMDGTSVQFVKRLISGELRFGVPKLFFAVVDVRDVAQAHILALQEDTSEGRYITSNFTFSLLQLSQKLEGLFPGKFPTAKSELPDFLMYVVGPLLGLDWGFLQGNLSQIFFFPSHKVKSLGLRFRDVAETLRDHVNQLEPSR